MNLLKYFCSKAVSLVAEHTVHEYPDLQRHKSSICVFFFIYAHTILVVLNIHVCAGLKPREIDSQLEGQGQTVD